LHEIVTLKTCIVHVNLVAQDFITAPNNGP